MPVRDNLEARRRANNRKQRLRSGARDWSAGKPAKATPQRGRAPTAASLRDWPRHETFGPLFPQRLRTGDALPITKQDRPV